MFFIVNYLSIGSVLLLLIFDLNALVRYMIFFYSVYKQKYLLYVFNRLAIMQWESTIQEESVTEEESSSNSLPKQNNILSKLYWLVIFNHILSFIAANFLL